MGDRTPLTWPELWAFGQATQTITEPWEYEALAAMSRAYLEGWRHGENPLAIAPSELEQE